VEVFRVFEAAQKEIVIEHERCMRQLMEDQCEQLQRVVEGRTRRFNVSTATAASDQGVLLDTDSSTTCASEEINSGSGGGIGGQSKKTVVVIDVSEDDGERQGSPTGCSTELPFRVSSRDPPSGSAFIANLATESKRMSSLARRRRVAAEYMMYTFRSGKSSFVGQCAEVIGDNLSRRHLRCERLKHVVDSGPFQACVCFVMLMNAVLIAWSTQRACDLAVDAVQSGSTVAEEDTALLFEVGEDIFNVIFMVELVLRIVAYECAFFTGQEWKWNMLDFCLVVPSFLEMIFTNVDMTFSFIRTVRLLRMLRTLRMIRIMRFAATFQHLRLMLLAVLNSIVPLFWAIFFLVFMNFLFAIMFMQATEQYLESGNCNEALLEDMLAYFNPLPKMILTLFMCISGGISWWEIGLLLEELGFGYLLMFLLFILIMFIVVLNIITGIFVNEAIESARKDHDFTAQMEAVQHRQMLQDLTRLFRDIDTDGDGQISLWEFQDALRDRGGTMRSVFLLHNLDVTDARTFFHIIDVDGSNMIEIDEFVMGCMRFKGNGHCLGIEAVMQEHKQMLKDIVRQQRRVEHQVRHITDEMHVLSSRRGHAESKVKTTRVLTLRGTGNDHHPDETTVRVRV